MNSRKSYVAISALLIAAITLSAAAFGSSRDQDGVQTATVEINDKGFEPGSLKLKAGAPRQSHLCEKDG